METEEDTWSISLLTGPHTDPQSEEQNEFNFPPALESFAEKIGIGLSQEWSDLKETPAPAPDPWFHDYALARTGPEEEVWGEMETDHQSRATVTLSELMTEEEVTTDITGTNIISKKEIPQISEPDYKDLDTFLTNGLEGQNFDLVEFAMGESGVGLSEDLTEGEHTKPAMETEQDDGSKISSEAPEFVEMKPVGKVSMEVMEETPGRRKVGRPVRTDPITVTAIPEAGRLSEAELKALKYRRLRDLNNKASRRSRLKKKEKEEEFLQG